MFGAAMLKKPALSDQVPAAKRQAEQIKLVGHFCQRASYIPAAYYLSNLIKEYLRFSPSYSVIFIKASYV